MQCLDLDFIGCIEIELPYFWRCMLFPRYKLALIMALLLCLGLLAAPMAHANDWVNPGDSKRKNTAVDDAALIELLKESITQRTPLHPQVQDALRKGKLNGPISGRGGYTGSGGGWGLAFFADAATANKLMPNPSSPVSPKVLEQIKQVMTLDIWEANAPLGFENSEPFGTEESDSLKDPLGFASDIMFRKLENTKLAFGEPVHLFENLSKGFNFIQMHDPNYRTKIHSVRDYGKLQRPIPDQARLVPLAIRYSVFFKGSPPIGFVDIDVNLYSKMNLLNQASLLLHETLYVLMSEMGQKDSGITREMVGFLFSKIPNFSPLTYEPNWTTDAEDVEIAHMCQGVKKFANHRFFWNLMRTSNAEFMKTYTFCKRFDKI